MGLGCNYVLLDAQTIQMVKVDEQGGAQSVPSVGSPFSGLANMAPTGKEWTNTMSASPFVVAPTFASLPKEIQELVEHVRYPNLNTTRA